MSPTKVIVAGGGIAGPVLAMLLKQKGYDPIVYERTDEITNMGLSLALQPNGLRVLDLIPGLLKKVVSCKVGEAVAYSVVPGDEGELARFKIPHFRYGTEGVRRPVFHHTLVEAAQERGIPVVFGHQLVDLEQHEESVTVKFANGKTEEASFVVGCDGLHSNTRICLFGKEEALFTGLTQTGGISPIPGLYSHSTPPLFNIYGDGVHMIGYPINESQISWAMTQREAEEKETWRDMDEERQAQFQAGAFSNLPYGGGELIRTADKIIKYGLYDRPELKAWHKGRVVLIGDAAHPTSPHLGQGANQAFEDIYHLVRLLLKYNPAGGAPPTAVLTAAFTELEQLRIPRTSALVKGAREQGESVRVVSGAEACRRRNEGVRAQGRAMAAATNAGAGAPAMSEEEVKARFSDYLTQPFEDGKSEI